MHTLLRTAIALLAGCGSAAHPSLGVAPAPSPAALVLASPSPSESEPVLPSEPIADLNLGCRDALLAEFAADMAFLRASDGAEPSGEGLEAQLASANVFAHARFVTTDAAERASVERWISRVRARAEGDVRCGEGVASGPHGAHRVVVAVEWLGELAAGDIDVDERTFHARIHPSFSDGYVAAIRADGRAEAFALPAAVWSDGERRLALPTDVVAAQLMGSGRTGPRVLALWRDRLRDVPPLPAGSSPLQRVQRLREDLGAGPLRDNRLLREAAASHASDVCAARQARHAFRTWPAERMRSLGLRARHLGEVVGRAASTDAALEALARSPSHRLALTDRRFTDGGLASVGTAGARCVVLFVAAWPQAIGG
ncbi:MAG: hypothetical protein AAF411_16230 [Myxococcota bacterium]